MLSSHLTILASTGVVVAGRSHRRRRRLLLRRLALIRVPNPGPSLFFFYSLSAVCSFVPFIAALT